MHFLLTKETGKEFISISFIYSFISTFCFLQKVLSSELLGSILLTNYSLNKYTTEWLLQCLQRDTILKWTLHKVLTPIVALFYSRKYIESCKYAVKFVFLKLSTFSVWTLKYIFLPVHNEVCQVRLSQRKFVWERPIGSENQWPTQRSQRTLTFTFSLTQVNCSSFFCSFMNFCPKTPNLIKRHLSFLFS